MNIVTSLFFVEKHLELVIFFLSTLIRLFNICLDLQGALYTVEALSFAHTFVKCPAGWWVVIVAALQPSW